MKRFCITCDKYHKSCPVCGALHPLHKVIDAATGFVFCSGCYDEVVGTYIESKKEECLTGKNIMEGWLRTIARVKIERKERQIDQKDNDSI